MGERVHVDMTGSKSTFRIFNKKRLMTLGRNDFRPADGEYWLFWNYMGLPLMHKVHSQLNARTYTFSPEVIRYAYLYRFYSQLPHPTSRGN